MQEIRLWRIGNSAQWVAWGIVQAKVEEMDDDGPLEDQEGKNQGTTLESDPPTNLEQRVEEQEGGEGEGEDEEEEFDYLAYAQERALFFWGDVLQLGLVTKEDLPAELLSKIKIVRY